MDTAQSGRGGAGPAACLGLGALGTSGSRRSAVRSGRGPGCRTAAGAAAASGKSGT